MTEKSCEQYNLAIHNKIVLNTTICRWDNRGNMAPKPETPKSRCPVEVPTIVLSSQIAPAWLAAAGSRLLVSRAMG